MKKTIRLFVVLGMLITVLTFSFGSFSLTQTLSDEAGTAWAAPGPGPGQGGPGQGDPGPEKPGPGDPKPQLKPLIGSVVWADRDKAAINIGAIEGVRPGMIFIVKPAGQPKFGIIAEIKAEKIKPHSTNCRVIKWLSPDHRIHPKDRVEKK